MVVKEEMQEKQEIYIREFTEKHLLWRHFINNTTEIGM